jgi:hypothetical protein
MPTIEAIDLCDLPRFMIPSQQCYSIRISVEDDEGSAGRNRDCSEATAAVY